MPDEAVAAIEAASLCRGHSGKGRVGVTAQSRYVLGRPSKTLTYNVTVVQGHPERNVPPPARSGARRHRDAPLFDVSKRGSLAHWMPAWAELALRVDHALLYQPRHADASADPTAKRRPTMEIL